MALHTLHPSLPEWTTALDAHLQSLFTDEYALLYEASVAVVGSRGKRLRPVMLMLATSCYGAVDTRVLHYAAAVELIHAASLVHDDVVDEADSRRGVPAAHRRWGTKFSVLLGDYLLARVFELAAEESVPAIMRLLSSTATDMGRAVTMELTALTIDAAESTYWTIIRGKTATLFGASAAIGAILGNAPAADARALLATGEAFGYAFQVADDLLDLQAGESERGKPQGIDWHKRRATLPLLYAVQHAPGAVVAELRRLWGLEALSPEEFALLRHLVEAAGGFDYGWRKVKEYQDTACANLE
ncbi:MAG TPA: polyprenyl synthetase family protein, partial [Armatimonadota bacterium]|nr:polyprenyl synthetase family protein [Armatimonadota bacterium]